jgi:hypothetical protein
VDAFHEGMEGWYEKLHSVIKRKAERPRIVTAYLSDSDSRFAPPKEFTDKLNAAIAQMQDIAASCNYQGHFERKGDYMTWIPDEVKDVEA